MAHSTGSRLWITSSVRHSPAFCIGVSLGILLDDFDTLAAQTYLYDCMMDIGDLLEILAEGFIPVFTKFGKPVAWLSRY